MVKSLSIFLKNNQITDINPEALTPTVPINLHLENNKISLISSIVFSVKEKSMIYLSKNQVGCVSDDVIEWLKVRNIAVDLKANPVQCECIERIDKITIGQELRGEIIVETTLPCYFQFAFFGNEWFISLYNANLWMRF